MPVCAAIGWVAIPACTAHPGCSRWTTVLQQQLQQHQRCTCQLTPRSPSYGGSGHSGEAERSYSKPLKTTPAIPQGPPTTANTTSGTHLLQNESLGKKKSLWLQLHLVDGGGSAIISPHCNKPTIIDAALQDRSLSSRLYDLSRDKHSGTLPRDTPTCLCSLSWLCNIFVTSDAQQPL